MRKKSKRILKCIMTFILTVVMMIGAVPEMNMTAYASSYYGTYLVTSGDTGQTLPDKVVHFNNYDWYIIADNSTAVNAGTVTLFAKDKIGTSQFNPRYNGNAYNGSTIKGYLDNLISTTFLDMSDAIVSVDLQDVNVTGVKLWLLSTSETEGLNINIRKCSSNWWLRTPVSSSVMGIDGGNGGFFNAQFLPDVDMSLGVRPALKLDLSKVEFNKVTKTFSALGQSVSVTNVNLEPSTPQTIAVGEVVSFTASISPNEATDKTVKWRIGGTDAGALKLYTDAACETPLGTDATEVMTVYAKGISTGNAIVTCFSNSDSAKFASCEVTVNTLQTQIEEVLTTITATGIGQASYSAQNVAMVEFSGNDNYYHPNYNEVNGWCGNDMKIEITAADGYTITRCVFYDDANHIATDSKAPFTVDFPHLSSTPQVNGSPIYEGSNGIKKIDVIGYAGHRVTISSDEHMTKTTDSGEVSQTNLSGAMTSVVFTANEGYYFPIDYSVESVNGVSVTRDSYTQITVSGTPTADATITLTAPTAKTKPDAPTTAAAVDCTTADNNDGKLTGVTAAMEYKKSDADSWTAGTGSDITGLVPGTYYVRLKATDTMLVSDNQELVISAYTVPGQVVAPVFNPAAGTYTEAQSVTISCETTGADIYYTTNGNEPTTGSTKYTGAISVASNTTIKAIAVKSGMTNSAVASAVYTIKTSPVITKAPEAITGLVYNGKAQALITAGEVTGGTLYYAVVKAGDAEPSAELYTTSIPAATNAGTYYVWYKAIGDGSHSDTEPKAIAVTIGEEIIIIIRYDSNGGSGSMKDQKIDKGVETELKTNTFTRENYSFKEWNTKSDGSGDSYKDKAKVTLNNGMTLYAQWTKVEVHNHTFEKVEAVEPGCETDGNKAYYRCTGCDKWFADAAGSVEITDKNSVIRKATGHRWDSGEVTKEATYTETGIRTYTCKNDGNHTKDEVIPVKQRDYSSDDRDSDSDDSDSGSSSSGVKRGIDVNSSSEATGNSSSGTDTSTNSGLSSGTTGMTTGSTGGPVTDTTNGTGTAGTNGNVGTVNGGLIGSTAAEGNGGLYDSGHKAVQVKEILSLSDMLTAVLSTDSSNSGNGLGSGYQVDALLIDDGMPLSDVGGTWSSGSEHWHYTKSDGTEVHNEWLNLNYNGVTCWYFFDEQGDMATGWVDYKGERYYLVPETDGWKGRMAEGWVRVDDKWYYFESTAGSTQGRLLRNGFTPDGHFVGEDGALVQ